MQFEYIIQQTIIYGIPLLIVALGGLFAERSGIINLALEGEMIIGAFVGAIFIYKITKNNTVNIGHPQLLFFLALLIAGLTGAVFSLLLSFSAIKLKADQTIGGTALNMLAPAIVCTIGLLFFNGEEIKLLNGGATKLYMIHTDSSNFFTGLFDKSYFSTYFCVLLFIVLSVWIYKSKIGMHLRSCGEFPQAADSVGINVFKMRYLGTTISGFLAGVGGYAYIATTANGTASSGIGGMGFLALAIMIFGNWNPIGIAIGAFMFGFLQCASALSTSQGFFLSFLKLPSYFYKMLPYLIVIIVLILTAKKSRCPKAEGIPYDKGMR